MKRYNSKYKKILLIVVSIIVVCILLLGIAAFLGMSKKTPSAHTTKNTIIQNDTNVIDTNNAIKHTGSYDDKD